MKVQELLDSEDKWTQDVDARNKDGMYIEPESPDAVKWCLLGALRKCYPLEETFKMIYRIEETIGMAIVAFNDEHSYEEVMKVVKELDL